MPNKKQTSKEVASKASDILKDARFGAKAKAVAASALAQAKPVKKSTKKAAPKKK